MSDQILEVGERYVWVIAGNLMTPYSQSQMPRHTSFMANM